MRPSTILMMIGTALVLGCANEKHPIEIRDAWVRSILPSQSVTAGYLTMTNTGSVEDRLLSVSTAAFKTVELHDMSVDDKGIMRMRKSGPLAIGTGKSVTLTRGGYHLMLIEPLYELAKGNDIPLTLKFEKLGEVTVAARMKDE